MRSRITAAVVILAALALAGAGLVVYAIQTERLDEAVNSALSQEVAEFEQRERLGDPDTGITYDSAIDLMTAALNSNVPSEDELIIAVWNDKMQLTLPGDHRELTSNSEFQSAVMAIVPAGGVRDVSTSYGDVRVAVKPVRDAETAGAMVFAYYLDDVRNDLRDLLRTYAVVAGLVVVAVAIGAYVVAGRLLRPVRDLRDTAREISESDLTNRITASGNDDLTDLTVTFNAMLDRLDEAFTTQRQFLDDVGHELKTPITIVRGHLELMRENDLAEVDATRQLVLDEMDRMARLVEELILLAKSRRPGFLRLEQTDVGLLTTGLFDKMRALAKRDWRWRHRARSGRRRGRLSRKAVSLRGVDGPDPAATSQSTAANRGTDFAHDGRHRAGLGAPRGDSDRSTRRAVRSGVQAGRDVSEAPRACAVARAAVVARLGV